MVSPAKNVTAASVMPRGGWAERGRSGIIMTIIYLANPESFV
jgi:hypothetical protein